MDAAATTDHIKLKQMFHNSSERRKTLICSLVSVAIIVLVGGAIFLCILWKQSTVNEKQEYGFICDTVDESHINHETDYCQHLGSVNCNITLLESIPQNLRYHHGAPRHKSTFHGWLKLLDSAKSSVYIASSYWTLRPDDLPVRNPSSWQGEYIFSKLIEVAKRGVDVKIVHEVDSKNLPNRDPKILQDMGLAEVRVLDMTRLIGAGIIHTKMWLVDNKHFYLGSANMDWRSLTQIKELGLLTTNCRCLANDMSKIFDIYWIMATPYSSIPKYWPSFLDTMYNKEYPLDLSINGDKGTAYLSSSPPQLCTSGRTTDIDSILDVIYKAKKFIHISVMDYSPTFLYTAQKRYWSIIDDALRSAAYDRGVQVHLMASDWEHTIPTMIPFLKSLAVVGTIESVDLEVRLFKVPASRRQARIPYSRVQHTKYMVTENVAYVGTSNWSADYFVNTAGIGLIINQTLPEFETRLLYTETIHRQVQDVFDRDWNSPYTKSIWSY